LFPVDGKGRKTREKRRGGRAGRRRKNYGAKLSRRKRKRRNGKGRGKEVKDKVERKGRAENRREEGPKDTNGKNGKEKKKRN
jgi:hypothetical protein